MIRFLYRSVPKKKDLVLDLFILTSQAHSQSKFFQDLKNFERALLSLKFPVEN